MNDNKTYITVDEIPAALARGERVFGLHARGAYAGQITRIPSVAKLDYVSTVTGAPTTTDRETIDEYWVSHTTVSDLVHRAH